ncbi:hypothetical protein BOTBODRAFT_168742 [Botryobasidium botryosum FD-172 SS1]|uniref:Uncharacterized protein n=1 Tax=Botryobasidium botryosum (strain FD-172 SS1) TaxID=930990 RepID=A0A067N0V2_BOTB1|nr:hypothetical protein BOTBODRAFT_168742 [Botryobasidium botryosum FD-172 SS1]
MALRVISNAGSPGRCEPASVFTLPPTVVVPKSSGHRSSAISMPMGVASFNENLPPRWRLKLERQAQLNDGAYSENAPTLISTASSSASSSRATTPEINYPAVDAVVSSRLPSSAPSSSLRAPVLAEIGPTPVPAPSLKTRPQIFSYDAMPTRNTRRSALRDHPQFVYIRKYRDEQMRALAAARRTLQAAARQTGVFDGSKKRKRTDDELVLAIWPPDGPQLTGAVRALTRVPRKIQLLDEYTMKLEMFLDSIPPPAGSEPPGMDTREDEEPQGEPGVESVPGSSPLSAVPECADNASVPPLPAAESEGVPDVEEDSQPRKRRRAPTTDPSDAPARSTRSKGRRPNNAP